MHFSFCKDGVAVVEENSRYLGVGGPAAGPFPGDELVAVAGESISKLTYKGVIKTILESSRPITLVFRWVLIMVMVLKVAHRKALLFALELYRW